MKILVFGKTGQVATELQRQGTVTAIGRDQADLSDPTTCESAIVAHAPDAVINAAAYTAVDKAEEDAALVQVINCEAPSVMSRVCAAVGIPFVQISTDYVFDGRGSDPFEPGHPTAPLGAYGRSKLAGEEAIRAAGGVYAILRVSWVVSAHGNNFVKTMLRLGAERDKLTIVGDQIGGPTPAADIAAACLSIARQLQDDPRKSGTYHFSGTPDTSWACFAREIFSQKGINCDIEEVATSAYPTPAIRPLNSRMDCAKTEATFGLTRPHWKAGLSQILKDLL